MTLKDELLGSMRQQSPALHFREVIKHKLDDGIDRVLLREELESLRTQVGQDEEDVILEVLDFLEGWCHRDVKI